MATQPDVSLDRLFEARSVALIGASPDEHKISGRPGKLLDAHGYTGEVYPVNPSHDEIRGRTCYDSVLDVPGEVDAAMLMVPAKYVPDVLRECGQKGVAFNIIISSGFGEIGDAGEQLEAEIVDIAEEYGVRVVGPNTLGMVNLRTDLTLTFDTAFEDLTAGEYEDSVAIVSQSGGFGEMLYMILGRMGISTEYWASTGNELDVDLLEVLEYVVEHGDVDAVVSFVESLKRGERFTDVAERALECGMPIVSFKIGESDRSKDAISSHTGKLTGEFAVYEAAFEEYGVCHVEGITDFKDVLRALTTYATLPTDDGGWGIVSSSGGAAILLTDIVERYDLPMADFADETEAALSEIVPEYGNVENPVDATANVVSDLELYQRAISVVLEDDGVENLLIQFAGSGPQMAVEYEDMLREMAASYDKTIVGVFTGGVPDDEIIAAYEDAGIATYEDPVRAVTTAKSIARFVGAREAYPEKFTDDAAGAGDVDLPADPTWDEMRAATAAYDVPLAGGETVDSPEAAVAAAEALGFPVAMEVQARGLEHKTEADAIALGVDSAEDVATTYDELIDNALAYRADLDVDGVTVQQFLDDGFEAVVGITETDLGPVMLFGWGGVYVEALDDVAYRTLPITEAKARDLLDATKAGDVLSGYRGDTYDVDALVDLMVGASRFYADADLAELEFNPVIVTEDEVGVVDFLLQQRS